MKQIVNSGHVSNLLLEKIQSEIYGYESTTESLLKSNTANISKKLGCQYIVNADFNTGLNEWTSYNSEWTIISNAQSTDASDKTSTTAYWEHQGNGHGHISQTLRLVPGCYLFVVKASVNRKDDVPNFWLYIVTQADSVPMGQTLLKNIGNQPLELRSATFCLNSIEQNPVTLIPINLYGDASVRIDFARLYDLK